MTRTDKVFQESHLQVGIVVIGRNEGARLRRCLHSVVSHANRLVYVDSGSIDQSIAMVRSFGVATVQLDPSTPFTAARARNAGAAKLAERLNDAEYLQFLDGDCELDPEWLRWATAFLNANADVAGVCGRLRETQPDASIFNRLCDLEWDVPSGEVSECGGIAMFRAQAFNEVAGFDGTLIAGEEPDLCFRLRQAGWRIQRLDLPMGKHDSAMFRPQQWWQRSKRSGYADMEASVRRGHAEPHHRRRVWSNYLWALPLSWPLWPLLWIRCYRRRGPVYATHIVLGKVPQALGQLEYWKRIWTGAEISLIEHK